MVYRSTILIIMATLIFRVPKDELKFREFIEEVQVDLIKDYRPLKRPLICYGDGIKMRRNGAIMAVVKVHSLPKAEHYIVVGACRSLTFNELVVDFDPMYKHLCVAREGEQYYETYKSK